MITRVRAVVVAVLAVGAVVVPGVVSAQASVRDCTQLLREEGFPTTEQRRTACGYGEEGDFDRCINGLLRTGVFYQLAEDACYRAQE